ncbi:MAG: hypothetical protein ACE5HI_09710 [bacterium]
MSELKIGFLTGVNFEGNSTFRGAILITDSQTKPLEFRVTAPIRPTSFQKTLYGEILGEEILVELITLPLVRTIKEKPEVILVRDPLFLGANLKQDIRIVRIYKEDEIGFGKNNESVSINSLSGKYEPILLETSKEVNDELPEIRKILSDVFAKYNLIEPFERVKLACEQVHAQKIGESQK